MNLQDVTNTRNQNPAAGNDRSQSASQAKNGSQASKTEGFLFQLGNGTILGAHVVGRQRANRDRAPRLHGPTRHITPSSILITSALRAAAALSSNSLFPIPKILSSTARSEVRWCRCVRGVGSYQTQPTSPPPPLASEESGGYGPAVPLLLLRPRAASSSSRV
jgi:hypothetical protein